ncbi:formylglycine-generating enzyme family protein [Leisingera sp. ANG-M1]|uniref:formylglycine-generating enzyme family protein n=1 Tax=Leisingera sp. ANG-M1 TaxID=1577895 RepID=UPI00068CAF40|nr:SUMF1/EgtB/PvdO family nonheme iron enzyme [Leisingera sp. ANG-M1]
MISTSRHSIVAGTIIGLVLAATGAALVNRGPDPRFLPELAPAPVTLSDGHVLHVQKYEVTVAEWNRCYTAGACSLEVRVRPGMDPAATPATGLSYLDVKQYVDWVSAASRHVFRLPTLAEWTELAAEVIPPEPEPLFSDPSLTWASAYLMENPPQRALRPSGAFQTTSSGITDLDGSVWEWTQDCYTGATPESCPAFYLGGEHLSVMSLLIRDPARGGCAAGLPPAHLGFRLVTEQPLS